MSRSIIMKKIATIAMAILMMITATCTGTLSSISPSADFSISASASAASYTVNDARKRPRKSEEPSLCHIILPLYE